MDRENRQKIKLLLMVELLRQESSEEHPLRTYELVDRIGERGITCDRRTLSADMELLNEYGFEVKSRFVGHQKGYYMEKRGFSMAELKILIDAVQAATFITAEQTAEFTDKIAELGGSRRDDILKESVVRFNTTKHTNNEIIQSVSELEKALLGKKQASFFYFDRDEDGNKVYRKDKKRYVVDPVAMIFNDDNYYLMAWSQKYKGITHYRVDRMDTVAVESEAVCEDALVKEGVVAEFNAQAFKMYGGDVQDVVLEFDEKLIGSVQDKFGEYTKMIRTSEGRCVASVRVQVAPTFWGWLFQFAGEMEIVSPVGLMDDYRERARLVTESGER